MCEGEESNSISHEIDGTLYKLAAKYSLDLNIKVDLSLYVPTDLNLFLNRVRIIAATAIYRLSAEQYHIVPFADTFLTYYAYVCISIPAHHLYNLSFPPR